MNWYSGNIVEAVNLSKAKNAIFVVYCEGADELSQNLTVTISDSRIRMLLESDRFVAIKIQSDSEAYGQFVQIYKLVPLPSIFFIGKTGEPLEVVTGITKSVEELLAKIELVLERAGLNKNESTVAPSTSTENKSASPAPSSSSASASLIDSEKSAGNSDDTEVVCEGGVCYKRPKEPKTEDDTAGTPTNEEVSSEEKLKKARELIEKRRKEKEEEDSRLAKERELQRRRAGQDLNEFKQRQVEDEIKKRAEERKRDKLEEQAVRKRILEQIAQDKAERAARLGQPIPVKTAPETAAAPVNRSLPTDTSIARIQFKKPDGDSEVHEFNSSETFSVLRKCVEEKVVAGVVRDFALATTFPRKEFTAEDNHKTLLDLGLAPTAVVLILPLDKASSRIIPLHVGSGLFPMLTTLFWGMVNPLVLAFAYVKNFIFSRADNTAANTGAQKRASEEELSPNDAAKRRNLKIFNAQPTAGPSNEPDKPYKRAGGGSNVHRLSDMRDSDDENNTWNGNSTQQQ